MQGYRMDSAVEAPAKRITYWMLVPMVGKLPGLLVRLLLSSTLVWTPLALGWAAFSVWLSVHTTHWVWFQRSGSGVGLAGVALAYRGLIRAGRPGLAPRSSVRITAVDHDEVLPDGTIMAHGKETPESIAAGRQDRQDEDATIAGIVLAILGTLIGGYGDLLGRLFGAG
jgi:hypothetical protein